jgi:hypothetical protein
VRSGLVPLVGWGVALMALSLFGALVFDLDALPAGLLAGAGALAVAAGLAAGVAERRRPRSEHYGDPEVLLLGSAATTAAVIGVAIAVVGATAGGPAFTWPGVGLAVIGAGGIVRERRATRRLLEEARES